MAVASCADQNSLIYEQKPDERVQAVLDNYNQIIKSGTNGWFLALETGAKGRRFYEAACHILLHCR